MQVVTKENLQTLIQTGSVPEFKSPEVKTEAKVETKAEIKPEAKPDEAIKPVEKIEADKPDKPRGEDGKFKAEAKPEEGKAEVKTEPQIEDDDVKLTKKIEKIIGKKHREMKEAQEFGATEARRAIAAEQRAAALEAELSKLRGTKSEGAKPDGEPNPEDFKTVGEYTRALVKYEAEQAGKLGKAQAETSKQQEAANAQITQFAKRQEAFMQQTADYAEVLEDAPEVPPIAGQYIIESDFGPQLAYHLAKNPDVIARLQKLSPPRVIAELGKLETKFEETKPKEVASNGVSKAPAPIQPLEAKSTPVNKDPSKMNFSELRAYRQQQERERRLSR